MLLVCENPEDPLVAASFEELRIFDIVQQVREEFVSVSGLQRL